MRGHGKPRGHGINVLVFLTTLSIDKTSSLPPMHRFPFTHHSPDEHRRGDKDGQEKEHLTAGLGQNQEDESIQL